LVAEEIIFGGVGIIIFGGMGAFIPQVLMYWDEI
jgi:hypothetical protein